MPISRRALLLAGAAVAAPGLFPAARAQGGFPNRPLRFVVPYAAGGPLDGVARLVGEPLGRRLGQNVLVENKGGASGILGADSVAKAEPDGHTLLFTVADTQVNNAVLFDRLPYDPRRDFAGVSQAVETPAVLAARGDVPASTLPELVDYLKANRGRITYGSWSLGGTGHLVTESLNRRHDLGMAHTPYRGENPMVTDLLAKQITLGMASIANTKQHADSGALKLFAVTGPKRSPALPAVPTLQELGYADPIYGVRIWLGVLAPAKTPRPIVERLSREIGAIVRSEPVAGIMRSRAFEPVGSTAEEFDALIRTDIEVVGKVVKDLGISMG